MTDHTPPTEIGGTPVHSLDDPFTFNDEVWVTIVCDDWDDERMWQFSTTTGRLIRADA